jgi:hypothetical protein
VGLGVPHRARRQGQHARSQEQQGQQEEVEFLAEGTVIAGSTGTERRPGAGPTDVMRDGRPRE